LGYVEGGDLIMEPRWAEGRPERFTESIGDFLRSNVDVIVVGSAMGIEAAKAAAFAKPVVFVGVTDPIGSGAIRSLAHPGGNMTGTSLIIDKEIPGKWVELARDIQPRASRATALGDPNHPITHSYIEGMDATAKAIGLELDVLEAHDTESLDRALARAAQAPPGALIVTASPFFGVHRKRIAAFALTQKLPTIGYDRAFVTDGGLISYGPSITESYRRGALYVDKILKGAAPGDLPVEQPIKFEFVVNLKTAKALGIAIPQSILVRADEVIE
jgi:putative ABC transport system substrate-binding protein